MLESNNIEFKREYTADLKKEVIAFANTSGGVIYVGRDNKDNDFVTNEIVQELLSVKQTRAYTIIREMVNEGFIIKRGSGKEDNEYVLV